MSFNIVFVMTLLHMANGFIPESSLMLGIIPALVLLYLSIKGWQGKFKEKTIFIMFIIGIITGFLIAIIQIQIGINLDLLIIYPFLEQIGKTVILNLRRFQGKQETIIYGLALGLGFGSIYPPASLLIAPSEIQSTLDLFLILMGSIGLIFLHGATGALIGYGVYQSKLLKYYLIAVIILIGTNIIRIDYHIQWINLIIGIILYLYVQHTIISIKHYQKRTETDNEENKEV